MTDRINRKDLGNYINIFSLMMFLSFAGSLIALFVKEFIFPGASKSEFIILIFQSLFLAIFTLLSSLYAKKDNTSFSEFFDKSNMPTRYAYVIIYIIILYGLAYSVELILT